MAKLTDDERYALALESYQRMIAAEEQRFRQRLADRTTGMVARAIDEMGDSFDERAVRKAMAAYERVYVEESMDFIVRVLRQSGRFEVAKRIADAARAVGLDELPDVFQAAYEELSQEGLMKAYIDRKLMEPEQPEPEPAVSD